MIRPGSGQGGRASKRGGFDGFEASRYTVRL